MSRIIYLRQERNKKEEEKEKEEGGVICGLNRGCKNKKSACSAWRNNREQKQGGIAAVSGVCQIR